VRGGLASCLARPMACLSRSASSARGPWTLPEATLQKEMVRKSLAKPHPCNTLVWGQCALEAISCGKCNGSVPTCFPFFSGPVPVPSPGASRCRCALLCYACSVPTGRAAHDGLSSFFPCTGRYSTVKTKGGRTAHRSMLQGRTAASGCRHRAQGRCQQASHSWDLLAL